MAQFAAVAMVISAATSVASGMMKNQEAKREARSLENQARLTEQEAEAEARIHEIRVRKFAANQKAAFLKNGVTLDGSPLMVLEETARIGGEEAGAIRRSGAARAQLFRENATQAKNAGRAALIGGLGDAAGTFGTYTMGAKSAGITSGGGASAAQLPVGDYAYGTGKSGNTVKISNPYSGY